MFLLIVFLLILITCLIAYLVILLTTSAIVFSKAAFALLAAFIASQGDLTLVGSSSFLNYVAWAAICLAAVYLLSALPRVDLALRFLCTILMSVLLIELIIVVASGLIDTITGNSFKFTTIYEILVKIVCVLFAIGSLASNTKKPEYDSPANPFFNLLERVLASLMYGLSVTFICNSTVDNWRMPNAVQIVILIISSIAAFFVSDRLIDMIVQNTDDKE